MSLLSIIPKKKYKFATERNDMAFPQTKANTEAAENLVIIE